MVWTHIKLSEAPLPMNCRWCGASKENHCQRWVRGAKFHGWEHPTRAQIHARLRIYLERLRSERN